MALPHAIIAIADPSLREAWHKTSDPFDFYYASNPFSVAAVTKVMDGSADQWLAGVTDYLQKKQGHGCFLFAEGGARHDGHRPGRQLFIVD